MAPNSSPSELFSELLVYTTWRDCMCEFVMDFILLFGLNGAALKWGTNNPDVIIAGLVSGCYTFALIESFGHIQGACINPTVTVLFMLTKRLSLLKGCLYVIFQCAGSYCGVLFLAICLPKNAKENIKPFQLNSDVTPAQGVGVEWVITSMLLLVVASVLEDKYRKVSLPGLIIGLTIACGVYVGAPYTGGCMHPGIAFGPAAYTNSWKHHWVYWVGPMLAAPTAVFIYVSLTWEGHLKKDKTRNDMEASVKSELLG